MWQFENRLPLILMRTLFPRENLYIYRYKGVEVLTDVNGGDANGARELLTSPMYRRFLPLMDVKGELNVLDIGANNGGFPLLLATSGLNLRKVVSVELNPNTFLRLRFNLERNLRCEVVALNAAVCGAPGKLKLSLGAGSSGDSIYNGGTDSSANVFEVEGLTFDQMYESYFAGETIDVCKIDIEGAEFDVFANASHQNIRNCRYLIMEIHDGEGRDAEHIISRLSALGFQHRPNDDDPAVHFFVNSSR
ncbi:MAG TPA: FkbM family methyltransferase [Pyrinomonadaceae bacterium]|nr:FkbM family methyltransferase [Pyrinomonadaceae bacterium]